MERDEQRTLRLRGLAKLFQVRWEAWPEYAYMNHKRRQIGYQLELAGTHPSWEQYANPGSQKCEIVFEALRKIAGWIIPSDQDTFLVNIEPHENTITYWSRHRNRPDVMLNITILHRGCWDDPIDESQDRALNEMELRLNELGARGTASLGQVA
jgi:hypothetical protein